MILRRVVRAALVMAASVLASACTAPEGDASTKSTPPPATAQRELQPVVLPDLSRLAAPVHRQIGERYASFARTLDDRATSPADRANAYGELGRVLIAAKFNDEAVACYRHAQALAPDEVRWPYYLAHAYLVQGNRAAAVASYERVLALRPTDVPALVRLAETHLDDGRPEAAEAIFLRAASLAPQSAAALFGAGRSALARRAFADAAQYLERALAIDTTASSVHYSLAMAYRALGRHESAEQHLRQRGNAWPALPDPLMDRFDAQLESVVAYENRGVQALRSGDFTGAAAAFRRGLELDATDASLRYWLGTALYAAGDRTGGVRELEAVVRRSPGFAKAHFSLGAIHAMGGRHERAIERFSGAVNADPTFTEARLRLAETLRATGQLESSLPHYEQVVKLDPRIAEAWIGGASALAGLRRYEKARRWLTDARHVHPDRPELADLMARLPPGPP